MCSRSTFLVLFALCTPGLAFSYEAGQIIIRGGFSNVSPDASSSALVLDGAAVAQSEADVDDNTQLSATVTYMLSEHWGIEALASTPFKHDITAATGVLGLGEVNAGDTRHLPPTITVQYYPAASSSRWQPFVGVGLNYTLFFREGVASELEGVLGNGSLKLKDSFGVALQAGVDYRVNDNLILNAGVRWIDIDTKARFDFAANTIRTSVDIDPIVYTLALGWRL